MIALAGASPQEVTELLTETRALTSGVFGANFVLQFVEPEQVRDVVSAATAHASLVEFFYSDPDPALVELVHKGGALAAWQLGSREEAIAAEAAGCDFIIAQGNAAGGHVRGTISLLALLDEVLDAVKIPVLAAGGIGTGRAMAAALAAGADGVRVGTRFVAAEEAKAHPQYVDALIAARANDSVYTEVFSVGWPDAPHRCLRASIEAVQAFDGDTVAHDSVTGRQIRRFQTVTPRIGLTGAIEAMPHWAGESVGGVRRLQPAAEIVNELASEAEALLRRW
jgi:nitronate monooxygenase